VASDVVVPEVGELGMDVTLVRWLKQPGDPVAVGEVLFELDTEKTVVEVEAWTAGTLADVVAAAGDTVRPRQIVARILAPGEAAAPGAGDAGDVQHETDARRPAAATAPDHGAAPDAPTMPAAAAQRAGASPRARALAREHGVDLAAITGTGPDGLITEGDVRGAIEGAGAS
jgi:pyruvate/2-oxoglutarate dehydrogenase complex dihydrolipoamide acyltransferase (E2) component